MDKNQQQKLLLGIGGVVLLLCMILGALAYRQSSQNKDQKTPTTIPTQPSLPRSDKDNSSIPTSVPEMQYMRTWVPNVNEFGAISLLGGVWWFLVSPAGQDKRISMGGLLACLWFIWNCFKWDFLDHLQIEKDSDTGKYKGSFPLDSTELLRGALVILFGVYGPLHLYLSKGLLEDTWARILCVAVLFMAGLRIKMYLRSNNSVPQWVVGLLEYLPVVIVAFRYLRNPLGRDDRQTKHIVGLGSMAVFVLSMLYLLAKALFGSKPPLHLSKK